MIGARDRLDRRLVQLYENVQTININTVKDVAVDDMWRNMSLLANTNKAYFHVKSSRGCAAAAG